MIRIKTIVFSVLVLIVSGQLTPAKSATSIFDGIEVQFELVDRDGKQVRFQDYSGKNVLLAFGFTHCLHICPMIAANMASALKISNKNAVGLFVSVDTERDTPTVTDDYARGYGDKMIGLSGSYDQLARAAKNFNVTFVVTKSEDNYTVQHTPSIFLIGPDGDVIDVFGMSTRPSVIASAMR